MNDIVKQRISDNGVNLVEVEHKIELLEQSIKLQEDHLKEIQDNNEEAIKEKKKELKQSQEQIEGIRKEIEELQGKIQDYKSKQAKQRKLGDFKSKITSKHNHIKGQIKLVTENSECPECTQEITEEHKKYTIDNLGLKSGELEMAITDIDTEMSDVADRINDIEDILTKISEKNSSITGINEYVSKLETGLLESIQKPKNDHETLTKSKKDLDEYHTTKYEIQEKKHHLNTVQELLKDSGIKTIIIRNYLPLINQLINKYLSALNFYINFQLDESFNETIKSRGRDAFQYGSFSEGEKLRIDLALLFTWREVARLKSSVATNLLVLDEIFDSSLDSTGVEDFLGILNSLGDDTHAFVISHKGDQILDKFGRVIALEKQQNFSKIVEGK
jgi:DNA repair exonuclease SbcCD ATPase subunit